MNTVKESSKNCNVIILDTEDSENSVNHRFMIEINDESQVYLLTYIKNMKRYYLSDCQDPKINFTLLKKNYNFEEAVKVVLKKKKKFDRVQIKNHFNINRTKKIVKKDIDFNKLFEFYKNFNEIENEIKSIPKDLIFSKKHIYYMIEKEIKKINSNTNYKHSIEPIDSNPYFLKVILKFDGDFGNKLKSTSGKNEVEFNFKINNKYYPLIPPKLEYISPQVTSKFLYEISNLKDLKLENWNYFVTFEYLIETLAKELENKMEPFLKTDNLDDENFEFNNLMAKLMELTNESLPPVANINLEIDKLSFSESKKSQYWASGTGYGHKGVAEWDIKSYQKELANNKEKIIILLSDIEKFINIKNKDLFKNSLIEKYIHEKINGVSILELDKNMKFYASIFNFFSEMLKLNYFEQNIINEMYESLKSFHEGIGIYMSKIDEPEKDLVQIFEILELLKIAYDFKKDSAIENEEKEIDLKEKYIKMVKSHQFNYCDVPKNYHYKNKKSSVNKKSMMRIMAETQNLKESLPVNWDTSILMRISPDDIHYASFFIVGPEGTPYHNGIFEFHLKYPDNYPMSNPLVNLMTTGNSTVRFNPNLYNCGKVCLSLLGTWGGSEGESWNPAVSTALQVLISIQSLIFIDEPYFNEPGWERQRGTPTGDKKSKEYNEKRRVKTIEWGINDKIKNPIESIKDFTMSHFRMKREELKDVTLKWVNDATTHKEDMIKQRNEMIELLDNLPEVN